MLYIYDVGSKFDFGELTTILLQSWCTYILYMIVYIASIYIVHVIIKLSRPGRPHPRPGARPPRNTC